MNCFAARFLKNSCFLILFVMLSFLFICFYSVAFGVNNSVMMMLSRMVNEKGYINVLICVNCFIVMFVSVFCLKRIIKKTIRNFNKQTNLRRESVKTCLFIKINEIDDGTDCFLQLRI